MRESDNKKVSQDDCKIIQNCLNSIGKGSANITCGLLSIFMTKGNAKVQLKVSKNKNALFFSI